MLKENVWNNKKKYELSELNNELKFLKKDNNDKISIMNDNYQKEMLNLQNKIHIIFILPSDFKINYFIRIDP